MTVLDQIYRRVFASRQSTMTAVGILSCGALAIAQSYPTVKWIGALGAAATAIYKLLSLEAGK